MKILSLAMVAICLRLEGQTLDVAQAILSIQEIVEAGDLDRAAKLIDSSLRKYPNAGGLLNLRGVVHAQRNELTQARQDFSRAVGLDPALTPAWQNLARACQLEIEQTSSSVGCAVESWEHVLRLQLDNTEAHRSLGRLYEAQKRFSDSLRELDRLPPQEAARTGDALVRCADLAALGQTSGARALAAELAARPDLGEADLESVYGAFDSEKGAPVAVVLIEGLDSRHAAGLASLKRLAVAYEQLTRPLDARRTLERVAALDPSNPAHLLELARLADKEKDYEGALGYLAHARDLDPQNAQIQFLFAMISTKLNLPIEARKSLARALELQPDNPAYNYAMGFVILGTRDAATASGYFEKYVKAKPQEVQGHYALGIAYFASGNYSKSKDQMKVAEGSPKTAGGAAYFLGRIARRENDLESATRYLRSAGELLPDFSESHTELARVLMLEGKLPEARAELDRAIQLDPESFQANEQLLVLYRRTHDPVAEEQAEIVKKLDEERSKRAELMLRTVEVRP